MFVALQDTDKITWYNKLLKYELKNREEIECKNTIEFWIRFENELAARANGFICSVRSLLINKTEIERRSFLSSEITIIALEMCNDK